MKLIKFALTIGTAVSAQPVLATTCATVTFSGPSNVSDWNPLTGVAGLATFTATATRVNSNTQTARIIFLDNQSGTTLLNTNGPRYDVKDPADLVVSAPASTVLLAQGPGPHFSWGGPQNSNISNVVNFKVPVFPNSSNLDYVGGTEYPEALRYSIACYGSSKNAQNTDQIVPGPTVSLIVPKLISLTSASAATLNFGNFTSTSDTVNIMLKSTSSVNVSVNTLFGSSSTNQMVLSGASMPYATNATIPYSMTLNGVAVFKGSTRPNQTRGGQIGATYPLVLTLPGQPSGKIAGNYSDTITLTLTPGI